MTYSSLSKIVTKIIPQKYFQLMFFNVDFTILGWSDF